MSRLFLFLALALVSVKALSQAQDQDPLKFDVIPPGPEAASIGKFVDQPVSAYTGVPNIDIPIYTLKSYELSVPVSLSYHASGLKWEEIPSWVGAGWTLNAGGIVSRSIRGRNDEDPVFGYFMTEASGGFDIPSFFSGSTFIDDNFDYVSPNCEDGETPQQYLDVLYASMGGLDLEPDQFFFSLPDGQSGKFIFSRSRQMRLFPHQFATITYDTNSTSGILFDKWMITGKDGTKYFFEKQETSTNSSPCKNLPSGKDETRSVPDVEAVSSWKLVRMENASGSDYIDFKYVTETYSYTTRMSTTSYDRISGTVLPPAASICNNNTTVSGWRLDEITTKSGYKVKFVATTNRTDLSGSKRLDQIKIFHNDTFLKRFDLTYSSTIFTMAAVQEFFEESGNTAKVPSYEFTYYEENPAGHNYSRESESLDHWGYYNGADNSVLFSSAVLSNVNDTYYAGANRQANLEACRWMTLKQIRYPTGGTVNYEYELNDFSNEPGGSLNFDHLSQLELIDSIEFTVTNTFHSIFPVTKSKPFTLSENTPVVLFYEIPRRLDNDEPVTGLNARISKSSGASFTTMSFVAGNTQVDSSPVYTTFTPGNYTLYGEFTDDEDVFDPGTQKFYVRIYRVKDIQALVQAGEIKGGGLRIKKIQSIGDNTFTKTYSYVSSATGKSSGKLFTFPYYSYFQEMDNKINSPLGPGCILPDFHEGGIGTVLVRSNAPTVSLGVSQGGYVGYSEVTEYLGDTTTNNGYTVYTFTNTPDNQDGLYPFVPSQSFSYKNGLALTTKVYTSANKIAQETGNTYTYQNDLLSTIQGVKVAQATTTGCTGCAYRTFTHHYYSEPTERVLLESSNTRVYDIFSDNYLETTSAFMYNAYDQVTQKSETVSNDTHRRKYTHYNYHETFKTSPVQEYAYYAPASLGSPNQQFEFIDGVSRDYLSPQKPTDIYLLETTHQVYMTSLHPPNSSYSPDSLGLFKHRLHVDYDTLGNAIAVTRTGDPSVTTYIWDSVGIFPIAQVINTTPANAAFTSFEGSSHEGGWTFTLSQHSAEKTGRQCHRLNQSVVKSGLTSSKKYIVSYWARDGVPTINGVIKSNDASSTDADGWKYYEKTVYNVSTVTISGTGSIKIDELRLYPIEAQMTTYSYDVQKGLISSTDVNNMTTFYSYNSRRQLEFVRDFEQNILKKNEYRYARD